MDMCKGMDIISMKMYVQRMVREGPRSEHTDFTRAVQAVIKARLKDSPVRTINALAGRVPISRSQLYLLIDGDSVFDMADLELICVAIGADPADVIRDAEQDDDGNATVTELSQRRKTPPRNPATTKKAARKDPKPRS